MSYWTIKPGNIAAMCHVITPEGIEHDCIFISKEKGVKVGVRDTPKFDTFPLTVRAAVNKQFGTVFALPIERRGDYMKACVPFEVQS